MTIEEKAQRIEEHCLSMESGCNGCKLKGIAQKNVLRPMEPISGGN